MTEDPKPDGITINLDETFNPYEDTVSCKGAEEVIPPEREPFNDYARHQDIIVGHQRNRTLSDYPRALRPYVRLAAVITLIVLIGGIVWDMFH